MEELLPYQLKIGIYVIKVQQATNNNLVQHTFNITSLEISTKGHRVPELQTTEPYRQTICWGRKPKNKTSRNF